MTCRRRLRRMTSVFRQLVADAWTAGRPYRFTLSADDIDRALHGRAIVTLARKVDELHLRGAGDDDLDRLGIFVGCAREEGLELDGSGLQAGDQEVPPILIGRLLGPRFLMGDADAVIVAQDLEIFTRGTAAPQTNMGAFTDLDRLGLGRSVPAMHAQIGEFV